MQNVLQKNTGVTVLLSDNGDFPEVYLLVKEWPTQKVLVLSRSMSLKKKKVGRGGGEAG